MPEYLSPGVFIEEIDSGPRPIAGVSTSTAGMVGVTRRGPENGKPRLVTTFLEFQRTFGGFLPDPGPTLTATWSATTNREGGQWWTFPMAVKGFFDNGGQRLFVKRVLSGTAAAATGTLKSGLTADVARDAAPNEDTLVVSGLLGFAGNEAVTIHDGQTGALIMPNRINGYSIGAQTTITLETPLTAGVRAARGDFVRAGEVGDPTVEFTASSRGDWGNNLQIRLRPAVGAQLPLLPGAGEGNLFVTTLAADVAQGAREVTVAPATGLDTELPADIFVRIGTGRYGATVADATADPVTLTLDRGANVAWKAGTAVQRVRRVTSGATRTVRVGGANRLYDGALVQFDTGEALSLHRVTGAPAGDLVTFGDDVTGDFFEGQRAYLVEAQVTVRFTDDFGDIADETFTGLHWGKDDPLGVVRALGVRSQKVTASSAGELIGEGTSVFPGWDTGWMPLAGGDDGYDGLAVAQFVGVDGGSGLRTGIVALEDIDEVAICAVPGVWSGTVQAALINHCEQLKDRFAILDPPDGLGVDEILDFRAAYDTKYAALYYPWVAAAHPVTGVLTHLPPAGHLAGIYAANDVARGVHKAPANVVIRGIDLRDGLAQDITRRHQDLLNPKGINALRSFPGMGNRVWGARTLSSDTAWKYINVRRLFLFLEESIDEGTQWVVFEPNAEPLWALVKQTVENFLASVWRTGALAGTTPDEAFFVACDRTTMTQDDLDNGRLICVIGVAPVFPAEFVIFRIQQRTSTQTV
ncbi:phage tail sheath family protein [Actinoplanes subtropicus]|uniref:phage tail sheath family protein n=1 Tax=Actinoplanes subtropicus TaxID=543632 RepID=UPI0004C3172F|nr:phage tail sheath subtilisin-like domain-containing protein [Actinoplanes subtropicus]